jgi:hypothetical protein
LLVKNTGKTETDGCVVRLHREVSPNSALSFTERINRVRALKKLVKSEKVLRLLSQDSLKERHRLCLLASDDHAHPICRKEIRITWGYVERPLEEVFSLIGSACSQTYGSSRLQQPSRRRQANLGLAQKRLSYFVFS